MNVLNKIKSKKLKEPLRVTDDPLPSPVQPLSKNEAPLVSSKSVSNIFEEKREATREGSDRYKPEIQVDFEEKTVSDYFSKKDKEKRSLMSREASDQFKEEDYKAYTCFNVKKGYTIGSICLFEGEIISKRDGKEQKRKRISVSCGIDAVSFPQSIAKIILSKVTFISEQQAVFVGEDIIKVVEKGYTKK